MIKKIDQIKEFAVFHDFDWDRCVTIDPGNPQEFRAINIIYGRNYSGKTTLSRIFRAFETGGVSDKYNNPSFTLKLDDDTTIDHTQLRNHNLTIRVFNEDFVRENLRFISNPDAGIEAFAILGKDNNTLEREIHALEAALGSDELSKESGLYAIRARKRLASESAHRAHEKAQQELNRQLTQKATGGTDSIKYRPERFGDQNYTKPKLEKDIALVSEPSYQPLDDEKLKDLEKLVDEGALPEISKFHPIASNLSQFCSKTEAALKRQIGQSDKIQELLNDNILNRWVQKGRTLHKNVRKTCGFCGNVITQDRWAELERHFDKESEEFEKELDALITEIKSEKQRLSEANTIEKQMLYSRFHERLENITSSLAGCIQALSKAYESLLVQLKERKDSILTAKEYTPVTDSSCDLKRILEDLENLRLEANDFTTHLRDEQITARAALRLHEVYRFRETIGYTEKLNNIQELAEQKKVSALELSEVDDQITAKKDLIAKKKRQLNDEEKGAEKVNEYLTHYFGHNFLKLEAVEKEDSETGGKKIHFRVMRDNHPAYHLSEGECRLLAFCYFMAKLEDIETKDQKPILWIDDPISSLDGNHVFFVYSIICDRLIDNQSVNQLFISTHSLDFLKYLRRLPGADNDLKKRMPKRKYQFLTVNRRHHESAIELMPNYLIEHVTEFNYLFHQIYKCSISEEESDSNYALFYNFGNNARKFLEMFLFYKYPDSSPNHEKLERFFGLGKVPRYFAERISNEYSHLSGVFERAAMPVVVPEMKDLAKRIVDCLKQHDKDQFDALLNSVGEIPVDERTPGAAENTPPSVKP